MSGLVQKLAECERKRFQIAGLFIRGFTEKEVADRMSMNVKTVGYHWAVAQRQIRKSCEQTERRDFIRT